MKLGRVHSAWREASATFSDSRSETCGGFSAGISPSSGPDLDIGRAPLDSSAAAALSRAVPEDPRAALAELARAAHARGWALGTSGNFSAVLGRDPLRLAITPSGVD